MVARHGVGLDDLDLPYLHQMKVVVTTTAAANSQAVAEHTLLLALTAARKLIPAHMSLGAGTWRREEFMGSSLSGSTFGLIGMGRIGQGVAPVSYTHLDVYKRQLPLRQGPSQRSEAPL